MSKFLLSNFAVSMPMKVASSQVLFHITTDKQYEYPIKNISGKNLNETQNPLVVTFIGKYNKRKRFAVSMGNDTNYETNQLLKLRFTVCFTRGRLLGINEP